VSTNKQVIYFCSGLSVALYYHAFSQFVDNCSASIPNRIRNFLVPEGSPDFEIFILDFNPPFSEAFLWRQSGGLFFFSLRFKRLNTR